MEQESNKSGVVQFQKYKNTYCNATLEDFETNKGLNEQIILNDNRVIRLYEPIFIESKSAGIFSAPFYANSKLLFGVIIDTKWFNIIIIWAMTIILYVVLYFDLLKKVFDRK